MQSTVTRLANRPRGATGSLITGPGIASTPSLSTSIFYSDFEDATDRSQWGTPPALWNDAYATSPAPLLGSYSLYGAGYFAGKEHFTDAGLFPDDTTGTVYARFAFRKVVGSVGSSGLGIQFKLLNDSAIVAGASLYWDNTTSYFYRIYAYSSSSDNYASPGTTSAFDSLTYWMYLTYNRIAGTVVAEIKDASHNLVSGYTVTITGAASLAVDQISISLNLSGLNIVADNVEVRKDTSWGT